MIDLTGGMIWPGDHDRPTAARGDVLQTRHLVGGRGGLVEPSSSFNR